MQAASKQLSSTEERALIKRARSGDLNARDRLMQIHYELARESCRRYGRAKGLDQGDADSEVFFAIAEAINGYDLRRRIPFRIYVTQRARGAVTWADRELRRQDLRKLTTDWRKRFGGHGPPGKGIARIRKTKPPLKAEVRERKIGEIIRYSDAFITWERGSPRKADRQIASWLWWQEIPMSQAGIARKLGISRSAVSQRRKLMLSWILGDGYKSLLDHILKDGALNNFSRRRYIELDYDW